MNGIGVDLFRISRIRETLKRRGESVLHRIYTKNELEEAKNSGKFVEDLAVKFAAKEAVLKAVGLGLYNNLKLTELEILRDSSGKPIVKLSPNLSKLLSSKGCRPTKILLSVSYDGKYAIAFCICMSRSKDRR